MEHQVLNVGRHPSQYFQRQLKDDCADRYAFHLFMLSVGSVRIFCLHSLASLV